MRYRRLVATMFLLAACGGAAGKHHKTGGRVDYRATIADPLGFLPIDSEIVLGFDAEQLRRSSVGPTLQSKLLAAKGQQLTMFKTVCGFDPMTSIRGLTIGITNAEHENSGAVLVVRGLDRVLLTRCMAKAREQGDDTIHVGADGTITIAAEAGASDNSPVVFGFVDESTLVMMLGPATTQAAFAAALAAGCPLRKSPAFTELIGRINLQTAVWFAINGNSSLFKELEPLVMNAKAIVGSVSIATGLNGNVRLLLHSALEAQQLTTTLQEELGMASGFFDKLELTADGNDVALVAVMNEQQLQTMLPMILSKLISL